MSLNKKYMSETTTYSEEGIRGALAGAGVYTLGALASFIIPGLGGAVALGITGTSRAKAASLKKEIEYLSEKIYKARLNELTAAERDGVPVPDEIKRFKASEILKGAIYGMFLGPFYAAYKGSEIEDLNEELKGKLAELEKVLKEDADK